MEGSRRGALSVVLAVHCVTTPQRRGRGRRDARRGRPREGLDRPGRRRRQVDRPVRAEPVVGEDRLLPGREAGGWQRRTEVLYPTF